MRSATLVCMAVLTSSALLAADNLELFFNTNQRMLVERGNILTRVKSAAGQSFNVSASEKILLPKSPYISPELSKRSIIAEERAFFPFLNFNTKKLSFFNTLFKYSAFTGTRYYSKTEGKIQTYILESRRIASLDNKTVMADPVFSAITNKRDLFFKVQDNRFGEIVFKSNVLVENDMFIVMNTNANTLTKLGMTIALPGDYTIISAYIYDNAKKGFYYYCVHSINSRVSSLLSNAIFDPESYAARVRAETVKRASILGLNWNAKLRPY